MASWATTEVSPFIFDGPLPPQAVIGRQQEADVLRAWARAGRFVSLYGPRRYGKTSLIGKVAWDASRDDEMPVIVVDLKGKQVGFPKRKSRKAPRQSFRLRH